MRIGIDVRSLAHNLTGVQRYTFSLIEALFKIDKENQYILFPREINQTGSNTGKRKNLLLGIARWTKVASWEQFFLPLDALYRSIDAFHFPACAAPLLFPCPYVVTIHDMIYQLHPEKTIPSFRAYLNIMTPLIARKAKRIITVSHNSKKDIMRLLNIPGDKISVIYQAISEVFRPVRDSTLLQRILGKYQISSNYIFTVGTLEPRKNIVRLIRAFSILKHLKQYDGQLVIAGAKGWFYDEIFKVVEGLNLKKDVVFTGYVPDRELVYLYNGARIFVFPSLYEGFGLPPLEAMSCGVPVIASRISSLPEVVTDAAILVNPYDFNELAATIADLLHDEKLQTDLIETGFRNIQRFSWDKVARDTLAVYNSIA
ncbi:MAG TPA: glycosyltransferase family 1 protein [Candidatus Scalindua sp.]|nr:glycosyltransferase family 1 protein [Candidatus Scalindua sp.]